MPRQVDHKEYRIELVQQCTELFARDGYTALTMRRIAQHLGVSTGTLYHYFENKEALFRGVVHDVSQRDMLQARASIPTGLSATARARAVLAYVEAMEPYFRQQNLVLIDYFRTRDPAEVASDPTLRRAADFYHEAVADVMEINVETAQALLIYLKGIILQRLYDGQMTTFADQAPYIEAIIEAGDDA